ncbi:MAG TPA: DNA topoisomerase IV subunit A [Alphaproteobacteria bacterium]|nr:DNA topoisomerase IV subunit A [Alphaproteobacteria bacterium]
MSDATQDDILSQRLDDILGEKYLAYALSTIMSRSLPDVRDGLKPVHRRVLYAMRELGLASNTAPRKSAQVVGSVIGKYHPHGDTAVYDALVRLAQDFATRYPLVDGQGNFGNIDGDGAAAMRYTEARLTPVAEAMLEGITEDAIDFRSTYDGQDEEPVVLPSSFPNLLANGASGIAVGMATSIPPHNAGELADALLLLIDKPKADLDEIIKLVPGPDFPTGGILVEPAETIREAYATGRGGFRVRARWEVEKGTQGTYQIIVTEIPYQVQKSRLIERIAALLAEKRLPLLEDVRDESAEDIRLVLVPKSRNVDAEHLMEQLFRATDLETRVPLNMNVLDGGLVPRVMSLKEALRAFLDHRHEVLERRSRHRRAEIDRRMEVLDGYLIAYLNIDAVIKIIRESDEPKPALMKRFKLTDNQAEAILNMRLRALRRLEEIEIRTEHDKLAGEGKALDQLLASERRRWSAIGKEIADMKKRFGQATPLGKRRTTISKAPVIVDLPREAAIEREPITVLVSEKGWVRAVGGHDVDLDSIKYKEGDHGRFVVPTETTERLIIFATNGKAFTLGADKLPRGRGFGEPLRLMIDLGNDAEPIAIFAHRPGAKLLVAAEDSRGFIVPEDEVVAQTRAGRQVLNLPEGVEAVACVPAEGDHVAVVGDNRKLLVFALKEMPEMARGRGVILQKYKDGGLADAKVFKLADGLSWRRGDQTRTESDLRPWLGERAQAGRIAPNGFPKSNKFA